MANDLEVRALLSVLAQIINRIIKPVIRYVLIC